MIWYTYILSLPSLFRGILRARFLQAASPPRSCPSCWREVGSGKVERLAREEGSPASGGVIRACLGSQSRVSVEEYAHTLLRAEHSRSTVG